MIFSLVRWLDDFVFCTIDMFQSKDGYGTHVHICYVKSIVCDLNCFHK